MGGSENLVDGVPVSGVVFEDENVGFEKLDLRLGFYEEVLKQFFVLGIEVVAHRAVHDSHIWH